MTGDGTDGDEEGVKSGGIDGQGLGKEGEETKGDR